MDFRIGCALRYDMFTEGFSQKAQDIYDAFGGRDAMLEYFASHVQTVELRTVKPNADAAEVASAVRELRALGLGVTIHGKLGEAEEFFAPYLQLFAENLQPVYNVTVHPTQDGADTERMLRDICDRIEKEGYPFYITLENQRMKSDTYHGNCGDVTAIVRRIGAKCLGTCFDFGHQLYSEENYDKDPIEDAFISLAAHTHIHSMYEGRTHFPLNCGKIRLEDNIHRLLQAGYTGVFSLELSADRFGEGMDIRQSFEQSVEILRNAVAQVRIKQKWRSFYQNEYQTSIKALYRRWEAKDCAVALVGHAGYIMKFGDTRIALDVAPDRYGAQAKILADIIGGMDAMIVTHAHKDHFDKEFVTALKIPKYLPDFLNLSDEYTQIVADGDVAQVGEVTLRFFASAHSHGDAVIPEIALCAEYRGESYLFPIDVRDYDFVLPKFHNVRALFAHLWWGKKQALLLTDNPYIERWRDFVKQADAREIYVGHLCEAGRTIENMWSDIHVAALGGKLDNAKPFFAGNLLEF